MLGVIKLIFGLALDLLRSRAALEAEILVLRQQIIVSRAGRWQVQYGYFRRGRVGRSPFSASDRLVLGWVCGLFDALASRRVSDRTGAGSPGVAPAVPQCRMQFAS
jgi:hypothetical protein